jgi:DNA-binding winged helix-turn-helix (wHTH) protein/TolB-like protein
MTVRRLNISLSRLKSGILSNRMKDPACTQSGESSCFSLGRLLSSDHPKVLKNRLNYLLKSAFNIVTPAPTKLLYEFGEFRLDVDKHRLLRDGEIVALTPKAVEILSVLIRRRGELVEREELMSSVWGDVAVEDGNLTVTISMLRKALGEDNNGRKFIETVPRLGYKFVADIREVIEQEPTLIVEKHTAGRIVIDEEISLGRRSAGVVAEPLLLSRKRARTIPIAAVAVLTVAVASLAYFRPWKSNAPSPIETNIKSVAVLPLKSLGGSPDDKALELGFADALITSLAKIGELKVTSINSVSPYLDSHSESRDIGQQLGVDAVVEGTLQRANGNLRVTLRLIRISDGRQLWTSTFDEKESEIFRLQDAMAAQTAQSLALHLGPQDRKRQTENREAYQAYLRGRLFFDRRTPDDYRKAIAEFQQAVALDPNYTLAYAGLADVYALEANTEEGETRDALYEKARDTANKALLLDKNSAEAHATLGWIKRIHDWDWKSSEEEFKYSLELNPNYVNALQWDSLLLVTLGRTDEALAQIEKAHELAPLSVIVLRNYYFGVRQYRNESWLLPALAEQIAALDESIANLVRLTAASRRGDHAEVIKLAQALQNTFSRMPIPEAMMLAIAYARTQQPAKAKRIIRYLEGEARHSTYAAYNLAMVYAELGQQDAAIDLLQRCFDGHDDRLVWIKVEPRFASLRGDARFQDILRRMNLSVNTT